MIQKLLTEHDHIRKTLNLLETQFFDLCRDRQPDLSLMRSIVVYIQEYPEQTHHPYEDMIYSIMLERGERNKLLSNLVADHTRLEQDTSTLRESLQSYIDGWFPVKDLKHQLSAFLSQQRKHMHIEELEVYPAAGHLLSDEDWDKVQSIVPYRDDPVFGERSQKNYEQLFHDIENIK
jgi:hemerythrin-like domain-containing protein